MKRYTRPAADPAKAHAIREALARDLAQLEPGELEIVETLLFELRMAKTPEQKDAARLRFEERMESYQKRAETGGN